MSIWTDFVRAYAKKHGITYPQAMRKAGPEYRKKYGTVASKKPKKNKKKAVGGARKKVSISGSKKSYKKAPKSRKLML